MCITHTSSELTRIGRFPFSCIPLCFFFFLCVFTKPFGILWSNIVFAELNYRTRTVVKANSLMRFLVYWKSTKETKIAFGFEKWFVIRYCIHIATFIKYIIVD